MSLSQSQEDYLEAVCRLSEKNDGAQVCAVARMLAVKRPSVVKAMRDLKELGLVQQEPYGPIRLTEKGRRVAHLVFGRHTLLKSFLVQLGVGPAIADRDACRMEHILSAETLERIRNFTENKR